jgi:WD40 repeat protein
MSPTPNPRTIGILLPLNGFEVPVAFSPDGRILAASATAYIGGITLWNVANLADPQQLGTSIANSSDSIESSNSIESTVFSPDGRTLATLTFNGEVQLWNVANLMHPRQASQLSTITTGAVNSIAFSPHGALATGDNDGTIQLWNVANPAHPSRSASHWPAAVRSSRWNSARTASWLAAPSRGGNWSGPFERGITLPVLG